MSMWKLSIIKLRFKENTVTPAGIFLELEDYGYHPSNFSIPLLLKSAVHNSSSR